MSEDNIKDIIIALINNRYLITGSSNKDTAKEVADMINSLNKNIKDIGI